MTNREWLNGLSVEDYATALRTWLEAEHQEEPPAEKKRTHKLQPGDIVRDIATDKALIVTRSYNTTTDVFVMDEEGTTGIVSANMICFTGTHLSALEDILQELNNVNEIARG